MARSLQLALIVLTLFVWPHADPAGYRLQADGVQLTAPSIPRPGQWLFFHVVSTKGAILSVSLSVRGDSRLLPVIWKAQEIQIRPLIAGHWFLHLVLRRITIIFRIPVEYPPLPPWFLWGGLALCGGGVFLALKHTPKRDAMPYDETLY